jgi:hypothetical protein
MRGTTMNSEIIHEILLGRNEDGFLGSHAFPVLLFLLMDLEHRVHWTQLAVPHLLPSPLYLRILHRSPFHQPRRLLDVPLVMITMREAHCDILQLNAAHNLCKNQKLSHQRSDTVHTLLT